MMSRCCWMLVGMITAMVLSCQEPGEQRADNPNPPDVPDTPEGEQPEPWTAPRVRIPAEIYWGAYRNMEQLVDSGASWQFVREHLDGILLHQAYWLFNANKQQDPKLVAPKLAALLQGKPAILEITRPHNYGKPWDRNWGSADGANYVERIKQLTSLRAGPDKPGLNIKEINVDFYMNIYKAIAWQFPYWTKQEILAQATGYRPAGHQGRDFAGYWKDLNARFFESFPGIQIHACYPPVYFDWDDAPALLSNNLEANPLQLGQGYIASSEFTNLNNQGVAFDVSTVVTREGHQITYKKVGDQVVLYLDGKTVSFAIKGEEAMQALFASLEASGNRMTGFVSDSPYPYMTWKGESSPESRAYREKIRTYENWLHARGARHTLIVNSEVKAANPTEWDQKYFQDSLADLRLHQREGGRADRYLLESWYDGPYQFVPEDKPFTYTNLAKQAILYLKGTGQKLDLILKAEDGSGKGEGAYAGQPDASQTLPLDESKPTQRFEVQLVNNGDAAALPWLVAQKSRLQGYQLKILADGKDLTDPITAETGYTLATLLEPGKTYTLTVELNRSADQASTSPTARLTLAAFWNPQDPTQRVRDVVTLTAAQAAR